MAFETILIVQGRRVCIANSPSRWDHTSEKLDSKEGCENARRPNLYRATTKCFASVGWLAEKKLRCRKFLQVFAITTVRPASKPTNYMDINNSLSHGANLARALAHRSDDLPKEYFKEMGEAGHVPLKVSGLAEPLAEYSGSNTR